MYIVVCLYRVALCYVSYVILRRSPYILHTGSPWFGGMNAPFRGSKSTPYEGGVRVPALIVDFSRPTSPNSHLSFDGKMHVSDWLPTLTTLACISADKLPVGLDGMDLSEYLLPNPLTTTTSSSIEGPRNEVLLEMWEAGDTAFGQVVLLISL